MIQIALLFALGCFGLAILINLYKIITASGIGDRILALDTLAINAIALITLYGIWMETTIYFEASMIFAMTGFISTVSYTRFILRGDIIE